MTTRSDKLAILVLGLKQRRHSPWSHTVISASATRARNMKSPVSHVNVIIRAVRVIDIGGLPPSAMTVSSRSQTVAVARR